MPVTVETLPTAMQLDVTAAAQLRSMAFTVGTDFGSVGAVDVVDAELWLVQAAPTRASTTSVVTTRVFLT